MENDDFKNALETSEVEEKRFTGAHMFALYPSLKEQDSGEGSFIEEEERKNARISERIRSNMPGFSLKDRQLSQAAWTLFKTTNTGEGLLSWDRITVPAPSELGVEPYCASPEEMAQTVKSAALFLGAGDVGISMMNKSYVNLQERGKPVIFEDTDKPAVTKEKFVIPEKMKWVVSLAIPMDLKLLSQVPNELGDAAVALGYGHSIFFGLSFEDEPGESVKGPWNNPGHKAWFEDSFKCFQYWQTVGNGCGICLAVCPYTKTHWMKS
jgi:hypothetical protein